MQIILGLSGPPRSGKYTIASIISELHPGCATRRMSAPLKTIALQYIPLALRGGIEQRKDDNLNNLGTTYRDLQIASWRLGRDLMGEDWLGHHLVDSIRYCHSPLILVPDFGRLSETMVLIHAGLRVLQIKVQRPGTTFEGDSREDFEIPGISNSFYIFNDGTLADLRNTVVHEIMPWLEEQSKQRPAAHPTEELPASP
jgi:hypothetical protein